MTVLVPSPSTLKPNPAPPPPVLPPPSCGLLCACCSSSSGSPSALSSCARHLLGCSLRPPAPSSDPNLLLLLRSPSALLWPPPCARVLFRVSFVPGSRFAGWATRTLRPTVGTRKTMRTTTGSPGTVSWGLCSGTSIVQVILMWTILTSQDFKDYIEVCFKEFGDRVKN